MEIQRGEIRKAILASLYAAYFEAGGNANLREIRLAAQWDEHTFDRVVDELIDTGLIKGWTAGGNYRITPQGVIYVERQGLAGDGLILSNQRLRTDILDALATLYSDRGRLAGLHITQIASQTGVDGGRLAWNLHVLQALGYVETPTGSTRITQMGLNAVSEWRDRVALAEQFEQIAQQSPHVRGISLQGLFGKIVSQQGWSQEESVRTSNEEIDLIVYREREYFLVECKWLKESVESSVIGGLYAKLHKRAGVRGIVVSMSGFTSGALEAVREYTDDHLIFLFGSEDIHSLIFGDQKFDDLLNEKFKELVMHKRVVFK